MRACQIRGMLSFALFQFSFVRRVWNDYFTSTLTTLPLVIFTMLMPF